MPHLPDDLAAIEEEELARECVALIDQSVIMQGDGRRNESLDTSRSAVVAAQALVQQNRAKYLPLLATALGSLGTALSHVGQDKDALDATAQSLRLREELATGNETDVTRLELARSLHNMGIRLARLGRHEEALEMESQAVALRRKMAMQDRDAALPALATSVSSLGLHLLSLGRNAPALAAAEEALSLHKELVARNREAFLPDLAMALNNLALARFAIGHFDSALEAMEEAVSLKRELAEANREAFLPDLAVSLSNLSIKLASLGMTGSALKASQEAVALNRTLVVRNRTAFLSQLATSLANLAQDLSSHSSYDEALATVEEAISLKRELAASNPGALPDLARARASHANILLAAERPRDAIDAYTEALQILLPHTERNPDAFGPLWQATLQNLIAAIRSAGGSDADAKALLESVRSGLGTGSLLTAMRYFQEWTTAHNAGRGDSALDAYAKLHSVLDVEIENRDLDPIRTAVRSALAQLGVANRYSPEPRKPNRDR